MTLTVDTLSCDAICSPTTAPACYMPCLETDPGKDFLSYRADDDAVAQAFLLLPPPCLSRLSRSAAARGTVADHNIALLCSPGVGALWLRGRFTDEVRAFTC